MKLVQLQRHFGNANQMLGALSFVKDDGQVFICKTLELPWKNNENSISCIPSGSYSCRYTRSNRLTTNAGHDVFTYEVLNVPNRAGIRIHSANFFFQLLGCIALGDAHKDLNSDGQLDVEHSGKTIRKFESALKKQDFTLIITNTSTTGI